ncbi:hypothetical protein FQZ97_976460 [compost metagenome]
MVATKTLSLMAESKPLAMNSMLGCWSAGSASTLWMIGVNRCCCWITATIAKKATSSAVKGRASWKARPSWCSSVMPLRLVISTITNRPISPTSATCRARHRIRISAAAPCTSSAMRWYGVRCAFSSRAKSASTCRTLAGSSAP